MKREILSVFLFFWALFALTNSGMDISEGRGHYALAKNLVTHGDLAFDQSPPEGVFQKGLNGRWYAGHEIGNTLFLLPVAWINTHVEDSLTRYFSLKEVSWVSAFLTSFQAGLLTAITGAAFFYILRRNFGLRILPAFGAAACLLLTTFLWTYTRNLFDGVLCTTLITLSLLFLLEYVRHGNKTAMISAAWLFMGLAFITRLSTLLIIVAECSYLALSIKTKGALKQCVATAALLIPFIAWQCWYNYLRTGCFYLSPVQTSYGHHNDLDNNILVGLSGLLASPGKSIFVYAPLLLLSVVRFPRFFREYRNEAFFVLFVASFWFCLHARLHSWYGSWGWGPRHFIMILPILFLPFAVYFQEIWKEKWMRLATILCGGFGFILAVCSIISSWAGRLLAALELGRLDDEFFVWSFRNSQSFDMLKAGVENIYRMMTHGPIPALPTSYCLVNRYAEGTVNVWPNVMIFAGFPWYMIVPLVIPFFAILVISLINIGRLSRES